MFKKKVYGFSLMEILVTIAIVGVVATIGVPAYQNQAKKGHVSNTVSFITKIRGQIEARYSSTGKFPEATYYSANVYAFDTDANESYSIATDKQSIQADIKVSEGSEAGKVVTLVGVYNRNSEMLEWYCGTKCAGDCTAASAKFIDSKYLPSSCQDNVTSIFTG